MRPDPLARAALVRTLRDLGLGLSEVRRVLNKETTVAEVATAHAVALEAQIRIFRLRRAVLSIVVRRESTAEEVARMHELAKLSAEERKRIVDDFMDEIFSGREPAEGMSRHPAAVPELPEDPAPAQVDAWVELATLIQDPEFRGVVRALGEYTARQRANDGQGTGGRWGGVGFVRRVAQDAGAARERGVAPESTEAKEISGPHPR